MKLCAKIIVSMFLLSLAGCIGSVVSQPEKPENDREAKKFAIRPDMAQVYIYNSLSSQPFCVNPIIFSEGPIEQADRIYLSDIDANLNPKHAKRIFSLTRMNTKLCSNDFVVISIKPGLAMVNASTSFWQFIANPGEIHFFRVSAKTDEPSKTPQENVPKPITVLLEKVQPQPAMIYIKENMRLVVSKPQYFPVK